MKENWVLTGLVSTCFILAFTLFVLVDHKPDVQEEIKETINDAPVCVVEQKLINEGYTQTITKSMGVYNYNGLRETYYSSKVLKHKDIGEWWCDSNGFWRTKEGYFVVAYTKPIGTIINISMGKAMCCDHCPTQGAVDIYTNWN